MEPIGTNRKAIKNRCAQLRWKGLYIDAAVRPRKPLQQRQRVVVSADLQVRRAGRPGVDEFECSPARPATKRCNPPAAAPFRGAAALLAV